MTAFTDTTFTTSGSTSIPVAWARSGAQILAEAELLAGICAPGGVDGIVCYPPAHHLYGYLMSRALPELLKVPCRDIALVDSAAAASAGWRRVLVATLPAAFAQLARCAMELSRLDAVMLVHSSAALPPTAQAVLADLGPRARLAELFGSTETGLVGWRADHRHDWTLASDVRFACQGTGPLRIESPRLAARPGRPSPPAFMLDDIITVTGERTFRWLGRNSRIVKVNGRPVDLGEVLGVLHAAVPGVGLSCQRHADGLRGEWFSVRADTSDPQVVNALALACRSLPAWQRPSELRTTDQDQPCP